MFYCLGRGCVCENSSNFKASLSSWSMPEEPPFVAELSPSQCMCSVVSGMHLTVSLLPRLQGVHLLIAWALSAQAVFLYRFYVIFYILYNDSMWCILYIAGICKVYA